MYCFFVWQLMLYFVGANIIIKGEKTVCQPFQCFMVLLFVCKVKKAENITYHIYIVYNEHEVVMDFTGKILEGSFPSKQLKLLTAWTALHEDELNANWILLSAGDGYFKIEPLR